MTAKIKLNAASGGGSFSLQAPSSSANNRVFTLPDIPDATMATVNGITMADQWRITADGTLSQSSVDVFSSNWERVDTDGFAQIGTGMTESSGIFTFPSTGIYQIVFNMPFSRNGGSTYYGQARIETTEDNSSYNLAAAGYGSFGQNFGRNTATADFIFDVTDTSTHKVRFTGYSDNDSVRFFGGTGANLNSVTFIRLGDT
tara:strand:+ start:1642 stop:2244 length:603 start_codon:yes stop_codon:yes gene_type:complete